MRDWEGEIEEALENASIKDLTGISWDKGEGRYLVDAPINQGNDPDQIQERLRGLLPDCNVEVHGPDENGMISIDITAPDDDEDDD